MEDRKITEQESLELISQMIQNTRCNLDAGSGNITGIIVRYKAFCLFSSIGLAIGLYMVFTAMGEDVPTYVSLLCFAVAVVFAMIIPGHMLNIAAKKENYVSNK